MNRPGRFRITLRSEHTGVKPVTIKPVGATLPAVTAEAVMRLKLHRESSATGAGYSRWIVSMLWGPHGAPKILASGGIDDYTRT